MAQVTAQMVKELRDLTGAGPLDCKKALEANDGDIEAAAEDLRKKGIASARKKLGKGRTMNEGVIEIYQHFNGRVGVIAEVNCETDFVASTDQFRGFAKDVVLHISSLRPQYVSRDQVPEELVEAEKAVLAEQPDLAGKPEDIQKKIIDGRLDKWYSEIVLLEQPFLKDDSKTIQQLLEETVAELGESIEISRFTRYELGGGEVEEAEEDEE